MSPTAGVVGAFSHTKMWAWEAVVCLGSVGLTQGSYGLGYATDLELYPKSLLT